MAACSNKPLQRDVIFPFSTRGICDSQEWRSAATRGRDFSVNLPVPKRVYLLNLQVYEGIRCLARVICAIWHLQGDPGTARKNYWVEK